MSSFVSQNKDGCARTSSLSSSADGPLGWLVCAKENEGASTSSLWIFFCIWNTQRASLQCGWACVLWRATWNSCCNRRRSTGEADLDLLFSSFESARTCGDEQQLAPGWTTVWGRWTRIGETDRRPHQILAPEEKRFHHYFERIFLDVNKWWLIRINGCHLSVFSSHQRSPA